MTTDDPAIRLLQHSGELVTAYFRRILQRYRQAPPRLMEAIEYSLLAGGKRLRPALVLETFGVCSVQDQPNQSALAAAAAIELIHTFSLVHDDLPAMDNDDLRRGRPTNHKVFGEALAILTGDAMTTMAFEIVADDAEPAVATALIKELSHASGPQGMIGGQVLDIDSSNQSLSLPELQQLHRMKTGALLRSACRMGAIAANAEQAQLEALTHFGEHLGLAFQIVDDLLDVTSTPQQLGKATNKDATQGKNTYPNLLGIERSQHQAADELAAAISAVTPYGKRAAHLITLAKFVVDRAV